MLNQFTITVINSSLAALATLAGVYAVYLYSDWAKRNTVLLISFSAGMIMTVALTHLLPEAMELNHDSFNFILFAIVVFYILEHIIAIHACTEDDCHVHTMGYPAFFGILLHSLIDGIIIGVSFKADFTVGLVTTMAILFHRLPVGIATTSMLLHAGFEKAKTIQMGIAVAVVTPIGAVLSYAFTRNINDAMLANLIAFSAGAFIYIGASDLIPETHKYSSKRNIPLVLAGVILVYLVTYVFGGH